MDGSMWRTPSVSVTVYFLPVVRAEVGKPVAATFGNREFKPTYHLTYLVQTFSTHIP